MAYFDPLILPVVKKPVRIVIGHLIGTQHSPDQLQNKVSFTKKRRSKRRLWHLKIYPISVRAIMKIKGEFETGKN